MTIKSALTIIGFTLLQGCKTDQGNDPFYLLEGNAIEVLEIENEKFKLSISKTPEEMSTINVELSELYSSSQIKKIQTGDRISKKRECYDLIIRRDGIIVETIIRVK